jgi:hypothetical protein
MEVVKRLLLVLGVMLLVGVSGAAAASVLASSPSPDAPAAAESHAHETEAPEGSAAPQDAGAHGGTVARFQQAGACDLTNTTGLQGNWTHGDYVSAVATSGDHAQTRTAAQSDCGKPLVATAGRPPAHALTNKAAGHAHRPDAANEQAAGPPGS